MSTAIDHLLTTALSDGVSLQLPRSMQALPAEPPLPPGEKSLGT